MTIDPDAILDGLDPEQRAVATALSGPVVVVAGAGTGKTRAMTHRLAYGAAVGAFDPRQVLALTFTTRAAGELRERLRGLGVPAVQARTFHSAALRQAQYFWPRAYGNELPPVADHRLGLVADALRREGLPTETALLRDMAGEISWAKVSNVSPADYPAIADRRHREVAGRTADEVGRVMAHYEAVKAARGVIDFEDILLCAAGLLAEHPDVAGEVRRQYRHFVVDEYQDVSPLQQALLDLWRGDSDDVCVVGDPAQTIHSFAGAQAGFLTGFTRRHPAAVRIELVRDYRSTPEVVALANAVMAGRPEAVELRAQRPSGPAPTVVGADSEPAEAAAVAEWLTGLHAAGTPWDEMAVLYRIHAQSPAYEAALADAGVPFTTRGSEGFFERAEVRAALRALAGAAKAATPGPAAALRGAVSGLGWTHEPPAGQGSVRERWESWAALVGLADDFERDHPDADAAALLAELERRAAAQHAPVGQGVVLSSLHAAKGLEWDAVAVVGVHEGGLPFTLASTPEEVEEERRLFYVGVTRAREHLRVSWSTSRNGGGPRRGASRFLDGLATSQAPRRPLPPRAARPGRSSALSAVCRVCGRGLTSGAERKLMRHLGCEAELDEALWEALRAWRGEVAARSGLPAFVVLTDATLLAVAERRPGSRAELAAIAGIGARKLASYGDDVLAVLASHPAPDAP
ncbi:ATP-dependent DNA helicase UvrD2 [Propioniciclava coleopterorum]|uniref:DNA 3'-5' helicase n=1 Tax=Propioniciclava coleopterorum TaxID=2714937 RepID=A0A6G7Y8Z9_9ACTN|nr:ATP-dependent DNA helicase UvrD2 [Propioniciclava coleopterorum]QIK73285.1 ATP-dependent DNA helicase UvrD2 [Propioniciclava coleopterorum]